jgi:GNAT superfamily N-acetyltransferase
LCLRPAPAADAATVAAFWGQGWRDGNLGNVPDALVAVRTPESFRTRAAERVADTTVAELDGEVAGFVLVVGDQVEQVYLSVVHRGGGIAALLLAEAERLVASGGHQLAWLAVVPGNTRAPLLSAVRLDRRRPVRLPGDPQLRDHPRAVPPIQQGGLTSVPHHASPTGVADQPAHRPIHSAVTERPLLSSTRVLRHPVARHVVTHARRQINAPTEEL